MAEPKTQRRRSRAWVLWPLMVALVAAGLYHSRDRLAQLYKGEPGLELIPAIFHPYIEEVTGSYFAHRAGPMSRAFKPVTFARRRFGAVSSSFDHEAKIISRRPSQGRLPFRCQLKLGSPAGLRRLVLAIHVLDRSEDQAPPSLAEFWSRPADFIEEKALPKDGRPHSLTWGKTLELEDRPEGQKSYALLSYLLVDKEGGVFLGGLEDEF